MVICTLMLFTTVIHGHFLFPQELLDKAKGLVVKGLKMIESNEQSKDSIKMKCDEIRELSDKFDKGVQKREDDLNKAMDIHECLEMVTVFLYIVKSLL